MSTSLLYHTQGIRGFQFLNFKYKPKTVIAEISKRHNKFKCSNCNSSNVTATFIEVIAKLLFRKLLILI